MKRDKKSLVIGILIATFLGLFVAWSGADNSRLYQGVGVFALCCAWAFLLNWMVFIPASIGQTERFYDLTGSLTYLSMIVMAFVLSQPADLRATIVALMVLIWAVRLGTFLFIRIHQDGRDDRFDEIKVNPLRFFFAWTVQALWTVMTAACALAIITSENRVELGLIGCLGIAVWILGFVIEVVADAQKRAFKKDPANEGKFINTGLWAWSQHPNYFGEITLWVGIALIALPVLSGWQWVTLISPVFVFLLLTRLSGIPMLRAKAEAKWGNDAAYKHYRQSTPTLIPMPPSHQ